MIFFHNFKQRFLLLLLLSSLFLGGCLTPSENESQQQTGELFISLTDAPGDFVRYAVDVTSIKMQHANGSIVETVPQHTQVDFAQYVDLSEFFTASQVPNGAYTKATLTLDFSNADIQVENDSGNAVAFNQIMDGDGNAITELEVDVQLDHNHLVILPGIPAFLALDFDLRTSNEVIWDEVNGNHIIVRPVLLADINPQAPKIHRVRGALLDVDLEQHHFDLALQPFHVRGKRSERRFGQLAIQVNNETVFDISGQQYQGAEGLEAMARLTPFTAIIAKGDLVHQPRGFLAREVYAGDSVPGGNLDVISGNIIARSGNTLSVRGATLVRAGGFVEFNDNVSVTLSENTRVNKQGSTQDANINDLSVGQRVMIFGTLIGNSQLDATQGHVKMQYTHLNASALSVDDSVTQHHSLTVDVQNIDRRRPVLFDFSGTGIDAGHDADIHNYEVDAGSLSLTGIEPNTPVKIFGHVNAYGQAPMDFIAKTISQVSDTTALIGISWQQGTSSIDSLSEDRIQFSLQNTTYLHHAERQGVRTDLTTLGNVINLTSSPDGRYLLLEGTTEKAFLRFSDFLVAVSERFDAGKTPTRLIAKGQLDATTPGINAQLLVISY